ncbi:MAG: hypothetical protein AAF629_35610 [Chloroflexota bacterium]
MTKKISRRLFLYAGLITSITAGLGGWWFFKVRDGDIDRIIMAMIYKKLPYLNLDEAGVRAFASDYAQFIPEEKVTVLSWGGVLSPIYQYTSLLNSARVDNLADTVARFYLISTDFFWHGEDETRLVKYLGLYDPYQRPCGNPFANLAPEHET